jgi:ABC-type uncharacterized transport system substrate-binding protein
MHATVLTPIVITEGYAMVPNGLVASLARPGGYVTGLGIDWMTGQRMLQLLTQAVPNISRLEFLFLPPPAPPTCSSRSSPAATKRNLVLTTNSPFSDWPTIFPNAGSAVALIDRLIHHADIITD